MNLYHLQASALHCRARLMLCEARSGIDADLEVLVHCESWQKPDIQAKIARAELT